MDSNRTEQVGFWVGLGGFVLFCAALMYAFRLISRWLDEEWAYLILAIPATFGFLIVWPIQAWYVRTVKRVFCAKHGHLLETWKDKSGRVVAYCERCGQHMQGANVQEQSVPPVAPKHSGHYDWMERTHKCPTCGWSGTGEDTKTGETFNDGCDRHCPQCEHRFGFIAYPFLEESISDSRASRADKLFAEIALRGAKDKTK